MTKTRKKTRASERGDITFLVMLIAIVILMGILMTGNVGSIVTLTLPAPTIIPTPNSTANPNFTKDIKLVFGIWEVTIENTSSDNRLLYVAFDCYEKNQSTCPPDVTKPLVIAPGEMRTEIISGNNTCYQGQLSVGTYPGDNDYGGKIYFPGLNGTCAGIPRVTDMLTPTPAFP